MLKPGVSARRNGKVHWLRRENSSLALCGRQAYFTTSALTATCSECIRAAKAGKLEKP